MVSLRLVGRDEVFTASREDLLSLALYIAALDPDGAEDAQSKLHDAIVYARIILRTPARPAPSSGATD
jgi:hypothetical protein